MTSKRYLVDPSWRTILGDQFTMPYMRDLHTFLNQEQSGNAVFPCTDQIFNALNLCPFDKLKVVLLGQGKFVALQFPRC